MRGVLPAVVTAALGLACAARADTPSAAGHLQAQPSPEYDARVRSIELLAYSAAMQGRKADTLAAVQRLAQVLPADRVAVTQDAGWGLTQQYAALVRFGLWDEMIALGAPDPHAGGLTAGYLYGRGVALAARGRIKEADATLAELHALAVRAADESAALESLRGVLGVAEPIVAARIAASAGRNDDAVTLLQQAVAAEDSLPRAPAPAQWFFPARHLLGAQLLIAGRAGEAQRVYRDDLTRNPANGWALYGLAAALRAQGRAAEAARVMREFAASWRHADVRLLASAFWFAGADTTSCECQRTASDERPRMRAYGL